jgi:hypothetical protein
MKRFLLAAAFLLPSCRFGTMVVFVVIGLLADKIFFSSIEKFLHRRWGTSQT